MTRLSEQETKLLGAIVRMSGGDPDLLAWAAATAERKGGATLETVLIEITPNRLREATEPAGNSLDPLEILAALQSAAGPSRLLDLRIHGVALPGEVVEREGALQILSLRDQKNGNVYIPLEDGHTRVARYTASLDAALPGTTITEVSRRGVAYAAAAEVRRGPRVFSSQGSGLTEILARRAAELAALISAQG